MSADSQREAITTLGLWKEDGTYTFPDGTTYYRNEPHYQPPLPLEDSGPRWRSEWPAFQAALTEKLNQGHRDYGDDSFLRQPDDLLCELAQEALDLAGWGFVLWVRLRDLEAREQPCRRGEGER